MERRLHEDGDVGRAGTPWAIRSTTELRALNAVAIGCALAGVAVGLVHLSFEEAFLTPRFVTVIGLSTFAFAVLSVITLRLQTTFFGRNVRLGAVVAAPLAMQTSGLALGILVALEAPDDLGMVPLGIALGMTGGAVVWIPLVVTMLAFFGAPIAYADRLAWTGLDEQERGERIVGIVALVVGLVSIPMVRAHSMTTMSTRMMAQTVIGTRIAVGMGALGGALALAGVVVGLLRGRARRAFLRRVDTGAVDGYRIDDVRGAKVLLRTTAVGEGYRVGRVEEEVLRVDASDYSSKSAFCFGAGVDGAA